ncbi:hypothetical protein WCD74_27150 [Actinomycetospora sp. OC33-EN08]|uniref:Transcriptional regulator n=1 Tax=Actinomycetospora aurantiaca TaxID=3129233 RepID=A0ABU8MW40_9PSEU
MWPHRRGPPTPLGCSLVAPLDVLRDWAETHMATVDAHRAANAAD